MSHVAVQSKITLTEGFRLPDGAVGSFTFQPGLNRVPADTLGALLAKRDSVTKQCLDVGNLVQMNARSAQMTLDGDLPAVVIAKPAIQAAAETYAATSSAEAALAAAEASKESREQASSSKRSRNG